jgi:hypothetical protein
MRPIHAVLVAKAALLAALAGAALPCAASASAASMPQAPDIAALADGTVHVAEAPNGGLPGKAFTAWTLVPAPVQRLCAMVQDYPSYAAYMPNTKSAQAVGAGDGYVLVDMTLDLPLGQEKKYRLRLEEQRPDASQCKLTWRLVPAGLPAADTIADTTGYWLFKPMPGGESGKTLVEYHVYADPGPVPFGFGWIVDMMSKRSLPRTLEALRTQAGK